MSYSSEVKDELLAQKGKRFKGKDAKSRMLLREAFLKAGSVSNPEKAYHFEVVARTEEEAETLKNAMNTFPVEAKIVKRKGAYVVYLKEGEQIVTMLGVLGASVALMNFENVRILKEMRNSVNRKVTCETANIHKTVSAAVKQAEAIRYIESKAGISALPDNLREIAALRLENPEMPLKELGALLDPPVGKSGVNHRLRRIMEAAEKLQKQGSL